MIECPYCNTNYGKDLIGKAVFTEHLGEVHRMKANEVNDEMLMAEALLGACEVLGVENLPEGWIEKAENWWDKSDARTVNNKDIFGDMNIRNKIRVIDAYTQHVISHGEGIMDTIFPTPEQILANPNTSPQNKVIIQDFLDQEEKDKDDTDPITDGVNWLKDKFSKEGELVKIEGGDITLLDEWGEDSKEVESGFVDPDTGELQKEIPDKPQYIDDARYTDAYREDLYGKRDSKELNKTQFVKDFFNLDNQGLDIHGLLDLQKDSKELHEDEWTDGEDGKVLMPPEDIEELKKLEKQLIDEESNAVGNYKDPAIHKADPFYVNQDIRLDKGEGYGRMPPREHWNQGLDAYGDMGYDEKLTNHVFDEFGGLKWSELPTDIQELYKVKHDYPSEGESKATEGGLTCEICGEPMDYALSVKGNTELENYYFHLQESHGLSQDEAINKANFSFESKAKEDFWVDPAGFSHTEDEVARGAKDTWNNQDARAVQDLRYLRDEDRFDDERIRRIKSGRNTDEWMGEDEWKKQDFGWQAGGESQTEDEVELARDLLKSQKGSDEPLDWQYGGEIGELDEDKEESKKAKSLLDELDELEKHHD